MLEPWVYKNYSLSEIYQVVEGDCSGFDFSRVNVTDGRINIALGHLLFETVARPRSTIKQEVDYSSYIPFRKTLVIALIESSASKSHGLSAFRSALRSLKDFFSFSLKLGSLTRVNLLSHFEFYCEHLREQIRLRNRNRKKGLNTANARKHQRYLNDVVTGILGENVTSHIIRIKVNSRQTINTEAPQEKDLAQHLTHYTELFYQFSDRLLKFEKLPWKIKMYGNDYFVFPYRGRLVSLGSGDKPTIQNPGYDYEKGEIRSRLEIRNLLINEYNWDTFKARSAATNHYFLTRRRLREANDEPLGYRRRIFASIAIRAYFAHFLIVTGMNDSVAATLEFDEVQILPGKRKFKNIKIRAGRRYVEFEIQSIFIKYFEKFLKLRDFVLNQSLKKPKSLFIEISLRPQELTLREFKSDGTAMMGMRPLDPFRCFLPKISTREYRVAKGQWISKRNGIEAASFALQHSTQTNIKSYNEASQAQVDEEVTHFYKKFNKVVLASTERPSAMKTEAGGCIKPYSPSRLPSQTPLQGFIPDCHTQEGCLFCDKYVVHTDEVDIRKLYSIKFFIRQYKNIVDYVSFEQVFSPLNRRVTNVIEQVRSSSVKAKILCEKIEQDVFVNEALSHYWE